MLEYLLDRLEDPFETFSMQHVTRSLAKLAEESENNRFDCAGPWGTPSPKYYTVEDEHDIEVVEHLVGVAFVLAQATITQAISLVKRMHVEAGCPAWIPFTKAEIMNTASPIQAETALSNITIIDAVADYYKHHYEWQHRDWSGPEIRNSTIRKAISLGLGPKGYHNMKRALGELGVSLRDMGPLAQLVITWRTELAQHIRVQGRSNGVDLRRGFWEEPDDAGGVHVGVEPS